MWGGILTTNAAADINVKLQKEAYTQKQENMFWMKKKFRHFCNKSK